MPEGIDLVYLTLQPAEIFWRMLQYREFDASEMSLSNYTTPGEPRRRALHRDPGVPLARVPPRLFLHQHRAGITQPGDLKGKRGGVPEYSMTAAVYMRGLLEHEYGVKPSDVEWVQGRADRSATSCRENIRLTQAPAGTELGDLLERGEIDFLMTANNPLSFRRGAPNVQAAVSRTMCEVEKDYFRRTRIYPIMHTVVIRRDIYERDPWVALSLYKALCAAKDRCYHLLAEAGSPKVSSAWLQPLLEEERAIIGPDWYPYGIEQNRPSIEALLQYAHEHGLTDAPRQARRAVRAEHAARHPARRRPADLAGVGAACDMRT